MDLLEQIYNAGQRASIHLKRASCLVQVLDKDANSGKFVLRDYCMQSLSSKYHYLNSGKIKSAPGDSNDLHLRSNSRPPGGQRQVSPLGPLSEGPSRDLPPKKQLPPVGQIPQHPEIRRRLKVYIVFNSV